MGSAAGGAGSSEQWQRSRVHTNSPTAGGTSGCEVGDASVAISGEDFGAALQIKLGDGDLVQLLLLADGHGGKAAAQYVSEHALQYIALAAEGGSREALQRAIEGSFARVHSEVESFADMGCSLTVVAFNQARRELCCANLGDSQAVLVAEGCCLHLTTDHRFERNADERERVTALGGKLAQATGATGMPKRRLRVWPGGLAIGRAIGNADCVTSSGTPLMSALPAFYWLDTPAEGFGVVVASDSVWEALSVDQVGRLMRNGRYANAGELGSAVLAACGRCTDDTTCLALLAGDVADVKRPSWLPPPTPFEGASVQARSILGDSSRWAWLNGSPLKRREGSPDPARASRRRGDALEASENGNQCSPPVARGGLSVSRQGTRHHTPGARLEASQGEGSRESLSAIFSGSMKGKSMLVRRMSDPDVEAECQSLSLAARRSGAASSPPRPSRAIEMIQASDPDLSSGLARVVQFEAFGHLKLLGEGEFATAYMSTLDGEDIAVKVLKAEKHGSQDAVRGLKREIMLLSLIEHPNIMRAIALGQHDNQPFMVMARLANIMSSALPRPAEAVPFWVHRREKKAFPLSRALAYGTQLAAAIAHCHDTAFPGYRVLHRDLKPKNIGLSAGGDVILFDFGLASIWKIDQTKGVNENRALTGVTGSLRYMAPEVAFSKPYNHKSDVFSFASNLYELCSHLKPYANLGQDSFYAALRRGVRPEVISAWPSELRQLFAECWTENPADRPECRDVEARLRVIAANGVELERTDSSSDASALQKLLRPLLSRRSKSRASMSSKASSMKSSHGSARSESSVDYYSSVVK